MTLASKITLVRVAMIPAYLVAMYLSGGTAGPWMWAGLAIFILASLTDYIDGQIARRCNQVSDFGKFLDPLADKLLTIAAMSMFCEWGRFPAWALMIVLTREFAVSALADGSIRELRTVPEIPERSLSVCALQEVTPCPAAERFLEFWA